MVLVSVGLTWMVGLPVVGDASLLMMMGPALQAPSSLGFVILSFVLVVIGALASFRYFLGGIPVLAGVGLFYFEMSRQLVLLQCNPNVWPGCGPFNDISGVAFGFGLWVAIGGAVLIFAGAIPQFLPWAKKRKKLAGAILAATIVSATGVGLGVYFYAPTSFDTIPPVAGLHWLVDGLTVTFFGNDPDDSGLRSFSFDNVGIVSYEWDFGDGATGTGENVVHTYAADGTYAVNLTVKDAAGNADSQSVNISVAAPPPAKTIDISLSQTANGGGSRVTGVVWQLTIAAVSEEMRPQYVLFKLYDPAGVQVYSASLLNLFTNPLPNVEFVPIVPSTSCGFSAGCPLQPGDKILVLVSEFPAGTTYTLVTSFFAAEVLAEGTLQ